MRNRIKWILVVSFLLSGCATAPLVIPPGPKGMPGIYHRVQRKETLWRISRMYNVDLDELARVNKISDTSNIEVNQLIFIPNRKKDDQVKITDYGEGDFIWPVRGSVICGFGQTFDNMINKGLNIHTGFSSDVVASRSGKTVFYSADLVGFGKTVIIDHGDGFMTVYARNSEVFIKPGDTVKKGSLIAKTGSWGRNKNTYLHFEIRKSSIPQNPYFYLPQS
ncbi:MAG: LysM peptidoglycan-binding domain-containing M23 family metallopeptidase [Candidatus Omnitrophica bacterium]|nr:LysM peptidoglycan-binding domain-containing M23 family metallopeptidase [Candidatus Omnitrophota bacterium]